MKMWAVKTVHLPEWVGNFNRYKRLILASLISAVLIISIIYMGSFPPIAQSGSGGSSNSFEIRIENVKMTNVTMKGPCIYNTTEGPIEVTNVTADVANMSEMLLVKEGSRLELAVPSAIATKLVVYTTYLEGWIKFENWVWIDVYGNETAPLPPIGELLMTAAYMEAVYMHVESFSALGLSVTCV